MKTLKTSDQSPYGSCCFGNNAYVPVFYKLVTNNSGK